MSRQFWSETLTWATADGVAVANTVTETILFPNVTIPANYLQDGRSLRISAKGEYSNTLTPTLIFGLRWGGVGGTLIVKSATITTPSGVTHVPWDLEILLTTRSNGSSGTLMANGFVMVHSGAAPTVASATGAPAVAPITNGGVTTPAVATVDLTADTALALTVTWGTANASNTITGHNYYIEALN